MRTGQATKCFVTQKLEASVVWWISYSPCKPGFVSSIPGFSSLADETLNRGPVSV